MPWATLDIGDDDDLRVAGARWLGAAVRRRRLQLGLTQRRLEALTQIDQTIISRIETGRSKGIKHSRLLALIGAISGLDQDDPIPP